MTIRSERKRERAKRRALLALARQGRQEPTRRMSTAGGHLLVGDGGLTLFEVLEAERVEIPWPRRRS